MSHEPTSQPGIPKSRQQGIGRRTFLRRMVGVTGEAGAAGGVLTGFMAIRRGRGAPLGARGEQGILRPPHSLEETDFLSVCIRCTRCSDACEAQCIRMFGPEAGTWHGTPYILPVENGCTMCLKCGDACPTGAIQASATKEDIRMGVAEVDKRLCVSHNGSGICGACHTACPLKNRAILQDYRNAPEVAADVCTGCGLCEEACIVRDRTGVRAIQVRTRRTWGESE